jgi:hypothetical protein
MLAERLQQDVGIIASLAQAWTNSKGVEADAISNGTAAPTADAGQPLPSFATVRSSPEELNGLTLFLLQYKYGEANEKYLHLSQTSAHHSLAATSHVQTAGAGAGAPSAAASSAAAAAIQQSLAQRNAQVDALVELIISQCNGTELLTALQFARTHTTNPLVRQHSVRYALDWLKHEQHALSQTGAGLIAPRADFQLILRAAILSGLTDVWSAIRKSAADRLPQLLPMFSLKQVSEKTKQMKRGRDQAKGRAVLTDFLCLFESGATHSLNICCMNCAAYRITPRPGNSRRERCSAFVRCSAVFAWPQTQPPPIRRLRLHLHLRPALCAI